MRINKIQTTYKPQQTTHTKNQYTTAMTNAGDVFISSGKISFGTKTFDSTYQALKKDIVGYVTSTSFYDEKSIENILRRYYPNVIFQKAERKYVGDSDIISHSGNDTKIYVIHSDLRGNKKAVLEKQTISAVFPENNTAEEKLLFASRLLHECTHMLQGCYIEKDKEQELINNFISKNTFKSLKQNIGMANWIYQSVHAELLGLSIEAINAQLPKGETNPKNLTASIACNNHFQETPEEMAQEMLEGILHKHYKLDNDFILDYCAQIAKCEVEAYSKEIEFLKSYGYDYEKTFAPIKLELNQAIIDAAATMKK